jgi:hypothetical protein
MNQLANIFYRQFVSEEKLGEELSCFPEETIASVTNILNMSVTDFTKLVKKTNIADWPFVQMTDFNKMSA